MVSKVLMALIIAVSAFVGCGKSGENQNGAKIEIQNEEKTANDSEVTAYAIYSNYKI